MTRQAVCLVLDRCSPAGVKAIAGLAGNCCKVRGAVNPGRRPRARPPRFSTTGNTKGASLIWNHQHSPQSGVQVSQVSPPTGSHSLSPHTEQARLHAITPLEQDNSPPVHSEKPQAAEPVQSSKQRLLPVQLWVQLLALVQSTPQRTSPLHSTVHILAPVHRIKGQRALPVHARLHEPDHCSRAQCNPHRQSSAGCSSDCLGNLRGHTQRSPDSSPHNFQNLRNRLHCKSQIPDS